MPGYLQGFDIKNLEKTVNWFNIMSYDIHGTWDGNSPFTKAVVNPHTNLTEISDGLDLLRRNNISPGKVVLGLGFYGRSFTLKDSSCNKPGCAFSSGGLPGRCTKTSGVLSSAEIQRIIKEKSLIPVLDKTAGVKYIVRDSNQWLSYDDAETLKLKQDYANNLCLAGTMVWALDLDDLNGKGSLSNYNVEALKLMGDDVDKDRDYGGMKARAIRQQNQIQLATMWTECLKDPKCPPGFTMLSTGHGKIFDTDSETVTGDGCHGGWGGLNRALCVEEKVTAGDCKWFGKAPSCQDTCPKNWVQVSQNSFVGPKACKSGSFKVFCCTGGNTKRSAFDLEAQLGTKYECDAGALYGAGSLILGVGGLYILNHLPGMWVTGDRTNRFIWKPLENLNYKVQSAVRACTSTTTILSLTTVATDKPKTVTCDFDKWPQPCRHYSSVIQVDRSPQTIYCNVQPRNSKEFRPATKLWNDQHEKIWRYWVPKGVSKADSCDRDEYPPFHFLGTGQILVKDYTQWIRWLPASQDREAGSIWTGLCDKVKSKEDIQGGPVSNSVCTEIRFITYTVNAMTMAFTSKKYQQPQDDGITENPCYLTKLTNDPGFALFTHDVWYGRGPNRQHNSKAYKDPPSQALLNAAGNNPPRPYSGNPAKRWLHEPFDDNVHPDDIIVDEGNSTRRATGEELYKHHGLLRCASKDCENEYINGQRVQVHRSSEKETAEQAIPEAQ